MRPEGTRVLRRERRHAWKHKPGKKKGPYVATGKEEKLDDKIAQIIKEEGEKGNLD